MCELSFNWIVTLAIGLSLSLTFGSTQAATVTLNGGLKDTTIFSNNTSSSAGGAVVMFSGTDGNSGIKRALVEFDIAGSVPSGSTITGAQLTLYLAQVAGNATTGSASISLHRLTGGWGEGTAGSGATINSAGQGFPAGAGDATWLDRSYATSNPTPWASAGGDFNPASSATATVGATLNSPYVWTSSPATVADVQSWLDFPASNFGWLLQNNDETTAKTFRAFFTRENGSLEPQLTINYTPVPEPTAIAPAGLLGLYLLLRPVGRSISFSRAR